MFRLQAASLFFIASVWAAPTLPVSPQDSNTVNARDSSLHRDSLAVKAPDSSAHIHRRPVHYRWPVDTWQTNCRVPEETATDCWRSSPEWDVQETGFPGIRSRTLSLSSLEPAPIEPFYQPALAASPYGIGGYIPFDRADEVGRLAEVWTPVLPVDTPITSLHWTRGALGLNQFTVDLRRMVGKSAYFGLQVHSDAADSGYYQYVFSVHQPYLSGWGIPALKRDSASLVIQDTSDAIDVTEIRPRLGFWLDSQTVVEAFADWMENKSSMANPTNPLRNDSTQLLYPAAFSATTAGFVAARASENYMTRVTVWHSDWTRDLYPRETDSAIDFSEVSSGSLNKLQAEWSALQVPGQPRAELNVENDLQENSYWLNGANGSGAASQAWGNQGNLALETRPSLGNLSFALNSDAEWRQRPDNVQEWLGGADGRAELALPADFTVTGSAGWKREGAPEDSLFRWEPALGLYPSTGLKPRTDLHLQAGGAWQGSWLGFGASWEQHDYGDNWLPRVLPDPNVCSASSEYSGEAETLCPDGSRVPDSLALALVNYHREIRDLLHLSFLLRLGNWQLSLLNTYLLRNAVSDTTRLAFAQVNRQIPQQIYKGQLLWRRRLLDGKLGLQTQWDWEWTSTRYVYGSDMDGYSRPLKLDEYLDLDFTARMEIKTFLLYFRAMNLNHDRYATEPGVHPPGVNFRFGIDWRLLD